MEVFICESIISGPYSLHRLHIRRTFRKSAPRCKIINNLVKKVKEEIEMEIQTEKNVVISNDILTFSVILELFRCQASG
jgi:hypothetical protein